MSFSLLGCSIIDCKSFIDDRGYFTEIMSEVDQKNLHIKQVNLSRSVPGVLRGIHFQKPPYAQGKLISVLSGKVISCVIDLRKSSKTYGQTETFVLTQGGFSVYVPVGFGNSFLAVEDSLYHYCCTEVYDKAFEGGICPQDEHLYLPWNYMKDLKVSEKDLALPKFKDFVSPFV